METVMEDDNLLEQILLHLPAETVHGCKSVSKHWCNLISSLRFRRRHATFHLHHPISSSSSKIFMIDHYDGSATTLLDISNGVTVIKTSRIESTKLLSSIQPFYEKFQKDAKKSEKIEFRVHDTYNGLFLFSLTRKREKVHEYDYYYEICDKEEAYYLVCNPLTKEYHELPITRKHKLSPFTELTFAPCKPYSGHYKVILVYLEHPFEDVPDYILKVYSSETGTWEDLGNITYDSLYESKSMVWDNCVLVTPTGTWCGNWVCVLDSERLRVLRSSSLLPEIITLQKEMMPYWVVYMGESGGALYVIVKDETWDPHGYKQHMLWEMKGVDGAWREKLRFKIQEETRIVYIHREGENVLLLLWPKSTTTVYYCLNDNTENFQEAGDLPDIHRRSGIKWNIRSYTPTLFPLGR